MQREEPKPEDLLLVDEVSDEGAARTACRRGSRSLPRAGADRARSARCEGSSSRRRQRRARARRAGRQDAVEHVDPRRDHAEDALDVAEAHEVARPVGRQERRRPADRRRASPRGSPRRRGRRGRCRRSRARRCPRSSGAAAPGRCRPARSRTAAGPARAARRPAARAQSGVRRTASSCSSRDASAGGQMSRHIAMSEPSRRWISATPSGVKRSAAPS